MTTKQRAEEAANLIHEINDPLYSEILRIIERALLAQKAEHEAVVAKYENDRRLMLETGAAQMARADKAEAERDELQRQIKNLAPTGRYNGIDIEGWYKRAIEAEAERTDNEEIGAEFLEQLKMHDPSYCWNTTPTEWVVDQINKYDDLKAERDAAVAEALERAAKVADERAALMNRLGSDAKTIKKLSHGQIQAERVFEAKAIAAAIRALKPRSDMVCVPRETAEEYVSMRKEYQRYIDGDPKMPFSLVRYSLDHFFSEADQWLAAAEADK